MLTNELTFRFGHAIQRNTDEEIKQLTGTIQGSILGLLALLLGFTFSMAMQRFDQRSFAVIDEANAIGTTLLRSHLLPSDQQKEAKALLREYIESRIAISKVNLVNKDERLTHNVQARELQDALWAVALKAAEVDSRPITSGSFINALNQMIDAQGKRNALLQMQVPESVMLLLFTVFLTTGCILGYSAGLGGKRVIAPTAVMALLIVLIVFIIIDLDRPRRGVIQVNQQSLFDLSAADSEPERRTAPKVELSAP
jgi:uncharacterized membrane protein (Fun14 family)